MRYLFYAATLFLLAIPSATAVATDQLPNIVLINVDDLGYGDLGCYGATKLQTPNIDALAGEGRRFTDAHSASAVCSPSRYGLMTGEYPLRRNLWGPLGVREPLAIDVEQTTIASLLSDAGYSTALIGKWHLGFGTGEPDWNGELKPGPLEVGFDYYFGLPCVNSGPPHVYVENHHVVGLDPGDPFKYGTASVTQRIPEKSGYNAIGGAERAHRLFVDELIGTTLTRKAIDWLEQQEPAEPFFLYFATSHIHHPFTPARRFEGTSECGRYGDFVHELDWMVGQLMTTLERIGRKEDTIVILTSDNGGMFNVTGQQAWEAGHRMNGVLLGFKFGAWEGGHRVPLIVRWPGRVPGGTESNALIGHTDLLATFAAITGGQLNPAHGRDSINQLAALTGSADEALRDTLIISPNQRSHLVVRTSGLAYIAAKDSGGFKGKNPGDHLFAGAATLPFTGRTHSDIVDGVWNSEAASGQLYDLNVDPLQSTNLYSTRPEPVEQLEQIRLQYEELIPAGKPLGWIN
ncbi:MAG: arylsulfatase [Planctomycetota bacterium]